MCHQGVVEALAGIVGQRRLPGGGHRPGAGGGWIVTHSGGVGQGVNDVQQVVLAALVGAAVALDQVAAAGNFQTLCGVPGKTLQHVGQPALDQRLLGGKPAAAPALAAQAGQGAQCQQAEDGVAANGQCQRPRFLAALAAAAVPALQGIGPARRQQRGKLGHAGLEMVVDAQQVTVGRTHLALHPLPAAGPAFEIGHPLAVQRGVSGVLAIALAPSA